MALTGLDDFRFHSQVPVPWDYAEVTSLWFEHEAESGKWSFDIVLWVEPTGVTGTCTAITIDDVPLMKDAPH